MAVFAMLAVVATIDPTHGSLGALELLGVVAAGPDLSGGVAFAAFLAMVFATVAALFLWTFLIAAFGHQDMREADEVSRYAFGGGVFALTALLLVGAVQQVDGLFVAIGTLLAALLVSYLAIVAERLSAVGANEPETSSRAQSMAAEAAHSASLARLTGRPQINEARP